MGKTVQRVKNGATNRFRYIGTPQTTGNLTINCEIGKLLFLQLVLGIPLLVPFVQKPRKFRVTSLQLGQLRKTNGRTRNRCHFATNARQSVGNNVPITRNVANIGGEL
jgi:hypothetical protein